MLCGENHLLFLQKNFQTVNYEGTNGWEINYFVSDLTEQILNPFTSLYIVGQDVTNPVLSYDEGKYINPLTEYTEHAGFYLKENKYCTNLINNSYFIPGEIISGNTISGIKGYYATVRVSTDTTTDPGGFKELYSVGSKFVTSSK